MSDAPSISTVAAAPTVASAVPATPPAQHTTSIVPAPPTAMPPAAVMPALPDAALEASASLHEKRLNECTAMAKRLEEMMAGLGDCQERLAELLCASLKIAHLILTPSAVQQACLNAEILVANSPQLADLARPVSEE